MALRRRLCRSANHYQVAGKPVVRETLRCCWIRIGRGRGRGDKGEGSDNAGEGGGSARRVAGSCVVGSWGRTGRGCCVWCCKGIVSRPGSQHRWSRLLALLGRCSGTVFVEGAEADCFPCLLFAILDLEVHRVLEWCLSESVNGSGLSLPLMVEGSRCGRSKMIF